MTMPKAVFCSVRIASDICLSERWKKAWSIAIINPPALTQELSASDEKGKAA
jgi:hypothetical protein